MSALDVLSIFQHPPPPLCSHTLRIDAKDTRGIFQALVIILKVGMGVLFSTDGVVDLSKMTEAHVSRLQEYFRGFCIGLNVSYCESFVPKPNPRHDQLKDYVLVIRLPGRQVVVSFDFLVPDCPPMRFA